MTTFASKTMLVKPIKKPEKINIFDHLLLVANDSNIERVIPDFDEKYMSPSSSNIRKVTESSQIGYFARVNDVNPEESVFKIEVLEKIDDQSNVEFARVLYSICITNSSSCLEDYIITDNSKIKVITQK